VLTSSVLTSSVLTSSVLTSSVLTKLLTKRACLTQVHLCMLFIGTIDRGNRIERGQLPVTTAPLSHIPTSTSDTPLMRSA
jgi:hypothetical protein